MLSCPTAFGREYRWTHLTTPQHLCCTLVGLINSGFVGISLEKREENRTQVTFGHSVLPSGSVQMPPSWVKVSLNFCQNWHSLLLWSQKHCLWFYLDMVLHLSTHDCFTLPESTLLRTGLYHLSFCPGMTPSDVSGRHSHLWIELNYHHLRSWVWVSVTLGHLHNILGPWLAFLVAGTKKNPANKHKCLLYPIHSTLTSRLILTMRCILLLIPLSKWGNQAAWSQSPPSNHNVNYYSIDVCCENEMSLYK